ncbi:hypothetical protein LCGC14_0665270 [marine sediment metagenome]|uniref:Uncharacterized protein n=1 Tax=marine sediment metagenome TaxID=412755 RepID=A0A0F9TDU6_9ZZZZ
MSKHIHDGRSHCPACALEKIGQQKQEIADLEAENARLQEREDKVLAALAQALGAAATTPAHTDSPAKYVTILAEERNGYKARDKLRGEALQADGHDAGPFPKHPRHDCQGCAAIAATPEEREKEKR